MKNIPSKRRCEGAERRSFETLNRILGGELAERLLRERRIIVKSADGREYEITDSGKVYAVLGGRICVQIEGEEVLPKYDVVLAKYLALRDRPDLVFEPPIAVVILERVPEQFVGVDLKTYGPFVAGGIARLPQQNAEVLIRHGLAARIDASTEGVSR